MTKFYFYAQSVAIEQLLFLVSGFMLISAAIIYYFYLRPRIFQRLIKEE
ncbi:MAG: hypothetical protein ACW97Z_10105 [Candidatus Hodarchaeales archaeon]